MWVLGIILFLFAVIYSSFFEGDKNAQGCLGGIIGFLLVIIIFSFFV